MYLPSGWCRPEYVLPPAGGVRPRLPPVPATIRLPVPLTWPVHVVDESNGMVNVFVPVKLIGPENVMLVSNPPAPIDALFSVTAYGNCSVANDPG